MKGWRWREGGKEGKRCLRRERREGWIGGVNPTPSPSLFSSGRANRAMREEDNGGQTNESVRDIMNSHTLMRPIYCRHQQWWRGEERKVTQTDRGRGMVTHKQYEYTPIHMHECTETQAHTHTHRAAYMTWRWMCNCSVFNPAMCLLSRHIRITVPLTHTHIHTQNLSFLLPANRYSPTHQLYLYFLNSYSSPTPQVSQQSAIYTHTCNSGCCCAAGLK